MFASCIKCIRKQYVKTFCEWLRKTRKCPTFIGSFRFSDPAISEVSRSNRSSIEINFPNLISQILSRSCCLCTCYSLTTKIMFLYYFKASSGHEILPKYRLEDLRVPGFSCVIGILPLIEFYKLQVTNH